MKEINGYARTDGTVEIVTCYRYEDGNIGDGYQTWTRTEEVAKLAGWPDEGLATVYLTDGGVEVLIPE